MYYCVISQKGVVSNELDGAIIIFQKRGSCEPVVKLDAVLLMLTNADKEKDNLMLGRYCCFAAQAALL